VLSTVEILDYPREQEEDRFVCFRTCWCLPLRLLSSLVAVFADSQKCIWVFQQSNANGHGKGINFSALALPKLVDARTDLAHSKDLLDRSSRGWSGSTPRLHFLCNGTTLTSCYTARWGWFPDRWGDRGLEQHATQEVDYFVGHESITVRERARKCELWNNRNLLDALVSDVWRLAISFISTSSASVLRPPLNVNRQQFEEFLFSWRLRPSSRIFEAIPLDSHGRRRRMDVVFTAYFLYTQFRSSDILFVFGSNESCKAVGTSSSEKSILAPFEKSSFRFHDRSRRDDGMTMGGMVVMASGPYSSVVLLLQLITITETGALSNIDAPYLSGTCTACRLIHPVWMGLGHRGRAKDWHSSE
jgi:hypothetical protein